MTSMPTSRARRAICSAPLEWPSRPGLPTRILIRWPIRSEAWSTRARSTTSCWLSLARRGGAVDAGRRPVGAEDVAHGLGPLSRRGAVLGGGDRRRHHVGLLV